MNAQKFTTKIYTIAALILIAGITLNACKKSDSASSSGTGKLSYSLNATNSGTAKINNTAAANRTKVSTAVLVTPSNVTWNAGYAYISKIEFDAVKGDTRIKIESKGLKKVDIFSAAPLFNDVTLSPGLYNEISLEVTIGNSSTTKEPAFFLSGTYGTTPIQFSYDEQHDAFGLSVEGDQFTFTGTSDYNALITLHLNMLLNGVSNADLDAAVKNTSGAIVINSTTNTSIYQKIKHNVQELSEVEFDHDDHHHDH